MAKAKVQAEIVPNKHCRHYHTTFRMTERDQRIGEIIEGLMLSDDEKRLNEASEAVKKLVIGVRGIAGIETFNFHGYDLQIVKAPLFDWEQIEPQVIGLIKLVGAEITGEEVEHIEPPIWEFEKWGLNADGTRRRRSRDFEDAFDDE